MKLNERQVKITLDAKRDMEIILAREFRRLLNIEDTEVLNSEHFFRVSREIYEVFFKKIEQL
jgi:hypothetical protein